MKMVAQSRLRLLVVLLATGALAGVAEEPAAVRSAGGQPRSASGADGSKAAAKPTAKTADSFRETIRPLLSQYCFGADSTGPLPRLTA
jgi:hypothetical protein